MEDLLIRHRIVKRNRRQVDRDSLGRFDQLQRIINDRQRRQAQKVHLEKTHLLNRLHVVRRNDRIVLRARHRHKLRQRLRRNHHACRMHARPAHQPFQPHRGIDQLANLRVFIGSSQRRRILQRPFNRDADRRRDQFCDAVDLAIRHIRARAQRP